MKIGILAETKHGEQRSPITPNGLLKLPIPLKDISVETSQSRCFDDKIYKHYGANICTDMSHCTHLFGIKEIAEKKILRGRTYFAFNHVGKGKNREYLQKFMDKNCTLYDYEYMIEPTTGKRMLGFGVSAGIVGAFEALYSYGQMLTAEGINTPLFKLNRTTNYLNINQALLHLNDVVKALYQVNRKPIIIATTGSGRVAKGVLLLLSHLKPVHIRLDEVKNTQAPGVYIVKIDKNNLYNAALIEDVLPSISIFINGIYWDERSPRILTKEMISNLPIHSRLRVISDITCDIEGSIENNVITNPIDSPTYSIQPQTGKVYQGYKMGNIAIVSNDNLPSAMPEFASKDFSDLFVRMMELYIENPENLEHAKILHKGKLTKKFEYLK